MNLLDFAKTMPKSFGEEEFIRRVNEVVDLKQIQSLDAHERQALHDFAQYLSDYMLLLTECFDTTMPEHHGSPVVEYRGPFIENALTRDAGRPLDRSQLESFGLGVADDRL